MRIPAFIRYAIIPLTIVSLFVFPWILTIIFMIGSGLLFPPAPFFIGILADFLYYPGHGWYSATLTGLIISALTFGVQHFVKTRIM